jgi:uridine kinase
MAKSTAPALHRAATPFLVAIAGGSGSGKSWLAERLVAALAPNAARVSLDDFYRDRSHLSAARRAGINFDHPRAIDWPHFERALRALRAGRPARLPSYDFQTHCRRAPGPVLQPRPIILVEGLWLLRRPSLRRLFAFSLFLDCPAHTRLRRRLARDLQARGRTRASVQAQFRNHVEPMHCRFVAPQARWADLVLPSRSVDRQLARLAAMLNRKIHPGLASGS